MFIKYLLLLLILPAGKTVIASSGSSGHTLHRLPGPSAPRDIRALVSSLDELHQDTTWMGFRRIDFKLAGRNCILVEPGEAAPGKPWIWRTEFFGHEPQADSTLAARGFHVAYMDLTDMYGAPAALDLMDQFYDYLTTEKDLGLRTVLEGFSRGGLFALNWAVRHPERVSCMYLDAPVCDFKSWPGGTGAGQGSPADWEKLKKAYGFRNDRQALRYRFNPLDQLKPLARQGIPILSVCGTADSVVPLEENTGLLEERYKKLGGPVKVILKPGVGHHPHSLKDPAPIVSFVLEVTKNDSRRP